MLPPRRHEISRVEAFSDAVFAFALTLLVVSLDVPTSYDQLIRLMAGFVPFAASFALLTWIWYEHNIFFRKYGLQDAWTITLNAALLFVVLFYFYVYPLKFLFTAAFSFLIPALDLRLAVTPPQLTRIFAIYGAGYVVLFAMFTLLHFQAYRHRSLLQLGPLEILDVKQAAGGHLISAGIGLLATSIALFAPHRIAVMSGFTYFLMGPAHWIYGVRSARRRRALETRARQAGAASAVA